MKDNSKLYWIIGILGLLIVTILARLTTSEITLDDNNITANKSLSDEKRRLDSTEKANISKAVAIKNNFKYKILAERPVSDVDGEVRIYNVLINDLRKDLALIDICNAINEDLSAKSKCVIFVWDSEEAYRLRTDAFEKFVPENYGGDFNKASNAKKKWDKTNYTKYAEHQIAVKDASVDEFEMYPLLDWYYKELGGKKVKSDTLRVRI